MKTKSTPANLQSGSYIEQALFKGLSPKGIAFAKRKVKEFEATYGEKGIPYGIIRKVAEGMK